MNALEGLRILDCTRLLPGPFATLIFADYGAEVIKIESPQEGDYLRWMPPALTEDISAFYAMLNRNKKHIALDLKQEKGREILFQLLEKSDVFLEGFRPGVMAKLGLDYPSLEKKFPRLIYGSITGYGQSGPYSGKAGHDINYLALSGILDLLGTKEAPALAGVQIADLGGGALYAVIALSFALLSRNQTGKGQYVDISMTDGALSWMSLYMGNYFASQKAPQRGEETLGGGLANYNIYATKDAKYLALGALEPKFWLKFCERIEAADLMSLNFANPSETEKIRSRLKEIFLQKTRQEWMEFFQEDDICLEPVLNLEEALHHPQIQARNLVGEMEIPGYGKFPQFLPWLKFSKTPGKIHSPPKSIGADTKEILSALGWSEEEIQSLQNRGIVR